MIPNNIVFVCRSRYIDCLIKKIGFDNSLGNARPTTLTKVEILDNHRSVLYSFGISIKDEELDLFLTKAKAQIKRIGPIVFHKTNSHGRFKYTQRKKLSTSMFFWNHKWYKYHEITDQIISRTQWWPVRTLHWL